MAGTGAPSGLRIREATETDAPALRDYAERLFLEDLPGILRHPIPTLEDEVAFIRSRADQPNSVMLLAEVAGALVGLMALTGESRAEESHAGTFGLSVDKQWRGRGIGGVLIEALIEWAPAHGVTRLQAYVCDTNPRALTLYERYGFEREGLCRAAVIRDGRPIDMWLIARLL